MHYKNSKKNGKPMKKIAILGSTGSIGTQTLEVIKQNPKRFELYAITGNNNVDLLIKQAREFLPEVVCIANEALYLQAKNALADLPIKVFSGKDSIAEMVQMEPIDIVVTAMVGYSGLLPTIKAIEARKTIALANKETLVVAGELICDLAQKYNTPILPVDSEHSAIFQCLTGEHNNKIEKIILTASGGPFRTFSYEKLQKVSAKQALKHPNWEMGAKITIDSASMMNKGFEVIEAKWLFGLNAEQIEVLVHPQSIIHSMVQFADGAIKAQLGAPDMRLPIQYALTYPERIEAKFPRVDFTKTSQLTFENPDLKKFRNLQFAFDAMKKGGNLPCILNAANEIVVKAFLDEHIGFLQMSDLIESAMQKIEFIAQPTYSDYVETDKETRFFVSTLF